MRVLGYQCPSTVVGFCLIFACCITYSCAKSDEEAKISIAGGVPSNNRSVVKLSVREHGGKENVLCTGTVIGVRHILTAAHCEANSVVAQIQGAGEFAGRFVPHHDFNMACEGADIAIFVTQKDIPGTIPRLKFGNPVKRGSSVQVVGFGVGYMEASKGQQSYVSQVLGVHNDRINRTETCAIIGSFDREPDSARFPQHTVTVDERKKGYAENGDSGGPGIIKNSVDLVVSYFGSGLTKNASRVFRI